MEKFYDAEKTNEYFEQMDGAIAIYAEQANAVLSSFATFAGDDEQKGEQAEAVKELVGTEPCGPDARHPAADIGGRSAYQGGI